MTSDPCVKDRIIKHTATGPVICQVVISRFVVVIEFHASSTSYNSLGRLCDGKAVDFIERAIEGLNRSERSSIPDSKHARDVSRNDLMSAFHPLYSDQTMIVTLEHEYLLSHMGIPDEDVVIGASAQD